MGMQKDQIMQAWNKLSGRSAILEFEDADAPVGFQARALQKPQAPAVNCAILARKRPAEGPSRSVGKAKSRRALSGIENQKDTVLQILRGRWKSDGRLIEVDEKGMTCYPEHEKVFEKTKFNFENIQGGFLGLGSYKLDINDVLLPTTKRLKKVVWKNRGKSTKADEIIWTREFL